MVTRLATCPKSGPNKYPVSTVPESGSEMTSESVVSPPGAAISTRSRPPMVSSASSNVIVGSGRACAVAPGPSFLACAVAARMACIHTNAALRTR